MKPDTKQSPLDATSIAVINTNIAYIQKDMGEIKQSIKELAGVYATQIYVTELGKAFEERIKKLETSSNLWKWLSPTLAAVVGSILTFLIIEYLSK